MNADIKRRRCGIEVLAVAKTLNSARLAFTSSMSPVLHGALAVPGRSWSRAGQHKQVIGEHSQPDPPLHPAGAAVAAPPQSMSTFQCADASFAASAPAQSCARSARARLPRLAGQDDVPDAAVRCRAFITSRREAAVGDRELRGVLEQR